MKRKCCDTERSERIPHAEQCPNWKPPPDPQKRKCCDSLKAPGTPHAAGCHNRQEVQVANQKRAAERRSKILAEIDAKIAADNEPGEEDCDPDWDRHCTVCGEVAVVPQTGMCGPCTWGEADTAGGNW